MKSKPAKVAMDGNEAAAYASYAFTEIAAIYPITPSSPMAEYIDRWSAEGKKNIFGETVKIVEMQSEAGAISTMHGAMEGGLLTSSYTSSQGLLLMIPTMSRIAGNLKSGVLHVASRSVAYNSYSISAEHSDVMACRQTGFVMLASSGVQDAMDLGAVAHLASIKASLPFLHFFDGFRTSHEIQKIDVLDYDALNGLADFERLAEFRASSLNPERPVTRSSGQTADVYFQSREACNPYYDRTPEIVQGYMDQINEITGRNYKLFNYYGAADTENVIIAIGSVNSTIRETVGHLNKSGHKTGLVEVHLYRPFSVSHFMDVIPRTVKVITVMDRTKESGSVGEPLFEDVCAAFNDCERRPKILACRYGLGGKDTNPSHIAAIYANAEAEAPLSHYTIGINDDVTGRSLNVENSLSLDCAGTKSYKFWGFGSDGTVGANKNTIKIISDHTDMHVQAFFEYDGKKSGGITKSHLRFGAEPILSSYLIDKADFVACHKQAYISSYDMHSELKKGGAFLLNCMWGEDTLESNLPNNFKKYVAENRISLYTVDATGIAKSLGMEGKTNTVLQAAFFKVSGIIPIDEATAYMKELAFKTYGGKGDRVIALNNEAIDHGIADVRLINIPDHWANLPPDKHLEPDAGLPGFVRQHMIPASMQLSSKLPVSAFSGNPDGAMPAGTSKYDRRGIAVDVPCWDKDKCIQCNICAFSCPHAAIRPVLLNEKDLENSPGGFKATSARGRGAEGYAFSIVVDPLDCAGCGSCVNVCPAKEKALAMKPLESQLPEQAFWDYAAALEQKVNPFHAHTIKGSQFEKPLLEFPGACPGCGETPYVKLVSQLFGDRMTISTATGCSLVWSTEYPVFPYTTNDKGYGPAMSNSLFENNAEFGLGMALGSQQMRLRLKACADRLMGISSDNKLKTALAEWLDSFDIGKKSREASDRLKGALAGFSGEGEQLGLVNQLKKHGEFLVKQSNWIIGGDGWAYDIGFGGLDHVLSLGLDVNILVLDTEVYSNTGGQASKATPKGAVAQFAASGRRSKKKDLGKIAMSYDNVYVAQVAMGANGTQLINALVEAESYPGTSLIIAYSPCINHGLSCGMHAVQSEIKRAVESGYWHLYRRNPLLRESGQNPFVLDSKEPTGDFKDFLLGETRYSTLLRTFPESADTLLSEAAQEAREKFESYSKMAQGG